MRCTRCLGAKKMYKVGGGYTMTNMGGEQVTCPLCNGSGIEASREEKLKVIENAKRDVKEAPKSDNLENTQVKKAVSETHSTKRVRDYKKEYARKKAAKNGD